MPKGRPKGRLRRPGPTKQSCDRVLVVCEGTKTEPYYLKELLDHYRLNTANVVVLGTGVDPVSIVDKAKKRRQHELQRGDRFDRIYCVFDRNSHENFSQASQIARQSDFRLARSWPCFEFWLLLHFQYTRKPYASGGGKSASQHCVLDLRINLPDYSKGSTGVFLKLLPWLVKANSRAIRAEKDAQASGEENPSTEFNHLVEYLRSMAEEQL